MTTRPVPPRNTILVLVVIYGAIAAVACREHTPREGAPPSCRGCPAGRIHGEVSRGVDR